MFSPMSVTLSPTEGKDTTLVTNMCARAKRNIIFGIVFFIGIQLFWVFFSQSDRNNIPGLQKDTRLSELKERLSFAENLDRDRKNELQTLRRRFEILIQALQMLQTQQRRDDSYQRPTVSTDDNANNSNGNNISSSLQQLLRISDKNEPSNDSIRFDPQFKLLLQNITDNAELQLPNFFNHMPHLSGKPESLVPALKVSKSRSGVSIVFGIPTIKRPIQSYLMATIRSLIDGLSEDERAEALLILMVAEADLEYVKKVHEDIRKVFADHLDSGLLEIISPHPSFYPDFDSIKVSVDTWGYLGVPGDPC